MATTDHNGLVMLDTGDPLVPVEGAINSVTSSVSNKFDAIDPQQIHYVADIPARTALAGTFTPTPAKPLYVHRQNAGTGLELEVTTDGTNWQTIRTFSSTQANRMWVGTGTITWTSSQVGLGSFTIPAGVFTATPQVWAQASSNAPGGGVAFNYVASASSPTAGTANFWRPSGTSSGSSAFRVLAIQM